MNLVVFSDRLSKFLMVIAAAAAFSLTFLILANIIDRERFDGVAEIVTTSIVIIVFLQAGYAIRSGSMLRADFLVSKFSLPVQKACKLIGYLLGAAFFLMITTGGWDESILSWVENEYEGEGALHVPAWPARWTVMFGSAIALMNYIVLAYIDIFHPELMDSDADQELPSH